jgi:GNAT superfamily N-acetyltransferase
MTTGTTYEVRALPGNIEIETLKKFAAIRLLSLQIDPSSFGSTYEREIAFTDDQWRDRLSTPSRATFIASIADSDQEWVATMTILAPSEITFDVLAPLRGLGIGKDGDIYVLVGMWVRPDHRRKGLGKMLIEEAFEWVRKDNATDSNLRKEKLLALQVTDNNDGGWALYGKMGFFLAV